MHAMALGPLILSLATFAYSVDITLFFAPMSGGNPASPCASTNENRLVCPGINRGACCAGPQSQGNSLGVLFDGLNTGEGYGGLPAFGSAFSLSDDFQPCGTSCNTGYGANVCVTCTGIFYGGSWSQPMPTRKRDGSLGLQTDKCTGNVEPSIIMLGGHHFNIGTGAGVSAQHTVELYALLTKRDTTLDDIPEHLMQHANLTFVPKI